MNVTALSIITGVVGIGTVIGGAAYGAHLGKDEHREVGAALGATVGIVAAGMANAVILALSAPAITTGAGVSGSLKPKTDAAEHLQSRVGMLAGAIPVARR